MLLNRIKLAKALLKLAAVRTDKAELIYEGELAEGVEVFVEREGEIFPAEDGEYVAEEKTIVVSDGRVVEIRVAEEKVEEVEIVDEQPEPETEPEPEVQEVVEDERVKELEARLAEKEALVMELEAKVAEMENALAEKDARIAELEAEVSSKDEELKALTMSSELPAKEKVKKEAKKGALKYFD